MNAETHRKTCHRIYGVAVQEALVVVWEAADRICGKRLKAILPQFIDSMERHGHIHLDGEVRDKLLKASAATIDRLLKPNREGTRHLRKKKRTPSKPSRKINIKTFADWTDPETGFLEIDFVVHCGGRMSGESIHSLVATDVCSGWTEAVPLLAREQSLVTAGLDVLANQLPMSIRGINSDNDSAFINDTLLGYCGEHRIEFTRARAYKSNDQAWIEQKNGAVIRRLVGYERYSGRVAAQAMASLYQAARLYVNYFQPSFKLLSKERQGGRFKRKFSSPQTPCNRLLSNELVPSTISEKLRLTRDQLDPVELLCRIRECQGALAALTNEDMEAPERKSLADFLAQLPDLWKEGEVRPTHARTARPANAKRTWRTRADPFEGDWPTVLEWLEAAPDSTAKSLFERLMSEQPGKYKTSQLRTLQRRVRQWRKLMAKKLVYACLPDELEAKTAIRPRD